MSVSDTRCRVSEETRRYYETHRDADQPEINMRELWSEFEARLKADPVELIEELGLEPEEALYQHGGAEVLASDEEDTTELVKGWINNLFELYKVHVAEDEEE